MRSREGSRLPGVRDLVNGRAARWPLTTVLAGVQGPAGTLPKPWTSRGAQPRENRHGCALGVSSEAGADTPFMAPPQKDSFPPHSLGHRLRPLGVGTLIGRETLLTKELVLWVQVEEAGPRGGALGKGPPQEHPGPQLASGAHLRRAQLAWRGAEA